jgi:UDP-N-acetyl-D-glucosamine/UDP-N-acetyl-D-galactosamine dehydrogenase
VTDRRRIGVIGLGYVGLPLAVALARHNQVTGFDRDDARIAELRAGHDRTGEVAGHELAAADLRLGHDPAILADHDLYIVTVPTPVDSHNQPDFSAVLAACRTLGPHLRQGAIVVIESTVYPGATEEVVGPALEAASGQVAGRDFFLGYAPERMNPGDREHSLGRIVKVVAGQTPAVTEILAELYGAITEAGIFRARDIRTAEAAKAIENAQRDINIAFVNEIAMICRRLGLSVHDVLDAAATKWNFLPFRPGLVGGHCIGVDPYYLAHKAAAVGHHPQIVLAGRSVNDALPSWLAEQIAEQLRPGARVLVLGLTFKEDVPDLRNSKAAELVLALEARGLGVTVHEPLADPREAEALYGLAPVRTLPAEGGFDAVVGVVAHRPYRELDGAALAALVRDDGLVADIKGIWRHLELPAQVRRWVL